MVTAPVTSPVIEAKFADVARLSSVPVNVPVTVKSASASLMVFAANSAFNPIVSTPLFSLVKPPAVTVVVPELISIAAALVDAVSIVTVPSKSASPPALLSRLPIEPPVTSRSLVLVTAPTISPVPLIVLLVPWLSKVAAEPALIS